MERERLYLANIWEKWWFKGREVAEGRKKWGSCERLAKELKVEVEKGILESYEKRGIRILMREDHEYPLLLKEVEGGPQILYVRGKVKALEGRMIGVVGSREYSDLAKEKIRKAFDLLGEGVIVSGLARGIDGLAHEEALRRGWKTVAVLGHGLEMVYPRENKELAERIVKAGGALISELPFGVSPKPWFFLERNRIVVGMSEMVLVVEGKLKSGTMSSANLAAEMGREVYAVSGSELTDVLIEEGANRIN